MDAESSLVSTGWVSRHLDDSTVKVVEVDVDTRAYDDAHVPGAVGWSWSAQLQDQVRRDIISKSAFEELLSSSGIRESDTVVLYGDNSNWFAAYAFWLLKVYGHPDVRLMDGGRWKWVQEDRATTREVPQPDQTQYVARTPDGSIRAGRDLVSDSLGHPDFVLVDVRSRAEYSGEITAPSGLPEAALRGGHIPGAVNVPWEWTVKDDGSFHDARRLQHFYSAREIAPENEVITYCRIGERSAFTWFVLTQLLHYPRVRNYDGSWAEWGNMIDKPVERSCALEPEWL